MILRYSELLVGKLINDNSGGFLTPQMMGLHVAKTCLKGHLLVKTSGTLHKELNIFTFKDLGIITKEGGLNY